MPNLQQFLKNQRQPSNWLIKQETLNLRINPRLLMNEAALQTVKWFDYRVLTPHECTVFFCDQYVAAYQRAYARNRDEGSAQEVNPLPFEHCFYSPEIEHFWRLRQHIDKIGIRYNLYFEYIFRRKESEGLKSFPRPNHLFSDDLMMDVSDYWNKIKSEQLQLAELDFFKAKKFDASFEQVAYLKFLKNAIMNRDNKHLLIARLIKDEIVDLIKATQLFGSELVKKSQVFT